MQSAPTAVVIASAAQLARTAGVAYRTARRYLSGAPIQPASRRRIDAAIAEHDSPRRQAAALEAVRDAVVGES